MKTETLPATARPMGRPPLNLKPVPVRIAPDVLARIDKLAGNYGRPGFIRAAIIEKLERDGG